MYILIQKKANQGNKKNVKVYSVIANRLFTYVHAKRSAVDLHGLEKSGYSSIYLSRRLYADLIRSTLQCASSVLDVVLINIMMDSL